MTPANRTRIKALGRQLVTLTEENPPASRCIFTLLQTIEMCAVIATDFQFRPEANDLNVPPRRVRDED